LYLRYHWLIVFLALPLLLIDGCIQVPLNSLLIDGNCRVEDRGLKTLHGQVSSFNFHLHLFFFFQYTFSSAYFCLLFKMIYVLCIYNKKEKEHQITVCAIAQPFNIYFSLFWVHHQITNKLNSQMGAYDIEDAMAWKKKIELIIDQV
jgi:hypothetical protein